MSPAWQSAQARRGARVRPAAAIRAAALAAALAAGIASAQEAPPRWLAEGPTVEGDAFSLEVPLHRVGTKLHVEVELGGVARRFVLDTGSPSMIDRTLAEELGLEVVDRRKGRDAHGVVVESEIVQADLILGGVRFRKVPLFAADLAGTPAARCLIGDGVLGSEILPLCAWQIDLPDGALRCRTDPSGLDHVAPEHRQTLHDFGYPHAPILDVRFAAEARSKAMLDTGAPALFVLSPPDFEGARRAGGVAGTRPGYGSPGASLGGQAPPARQTRAALKRLAIGTLDLGGVDAAVRASPPSLIGASILERFVVTLDPRSGSAWFDPYGEGPLDRPSFGFTLAFDGAVSIGTVWEGSPAARAGLKAGTRLTGIGGAPAELSCAGIRRALDAMSGETIRLTWDDGAATLSRE